MNIYKMVACLFFTVLLCPVYVSQSQSSDEIVIQEKVALGSFTPNNPPMVGYQDNNLKLSTIYTENQILLQIESPISAPLLVTLPDEMAQVTNLKPIYGDQIAAMGLVNSTVSEIAIINWKKRKIVDTFYGYKPTISPDGRWIAFQEFFPPHFNDDIHSSYRVYDTSLDAKGNRHGLPDISNAQLVGIIVYPLQANVQIDHVMAGNFFWGTQSNQFIFVTDEGKAVHLVLAKVKEDGKAWETLLYDLNHDGSACSTTCNLAKVTSLTMENGVVAVQVFPGESGTKGLKYNVPIDLFKPIN